MTTSTEQNDRPGRPAISVTPLFAMVGATDLAVQQVRAGASSLQQRVQSDLEARLAGVEKRVGALDPRLLRAQAEQAPNRAVAKALEAAGRAEAAYEELARRGKDLVDRVSTQADTQAFRAQAGSTLSRGRAAVTVARRAADDTAVAIRESLTLGRAEVAHTAQDAAEQVIELDRQADSAAGTVATEAQQAAARTRSSAKKTAATAGKNTAATKSAAKGARTSARKTASTGTRAAKSGAGKTGQARRSEQS